MATINNDLLIRIKGDVDSAKKAFAEVEKSLAQIGAASVSSAKKTESGFSATRRGVESISASLAGLRALFIQVQAARAAFAAAGGLTATIDAYNAFTARLRLAVSGQQAFAAALENVTRIANANQSRLDTVASLYTRLSQATAALGASQSDVSKITEAVALSLRISGATAQESSAAILQLAQAFGSGVLRGDEFNSVNEAAPRLMQALADGLGRPVGELRTMAENGQLTAEVVGNALPKALAQLRAEAASIPPTIGGAFQVLQNRLSQTIAAFDKATGFSNALSRTVLAMSENLGLATVAVTALGTAFAALGAKIAAGAGLSGTAAVLAGITRVLLGPVGLVAALLSGAAAWLSFQTKGTQSVKAVADKFRELNKARAEAAKVTGGGTAFDPKNDPLAVAVETQRQNVETAKANLKQLEKLAKNIDVGQAARAALPRAREELALNVQALEEAKQALIEASKPVNLTAPVKSVDAAKAEAGIKTRLDIENTYQQQRQALVAAYDAAIAQASSEAARAGLLKDRDEALKILDDAKAKQTAGDPKTAPRNDSAGVAARLAAAKDEADAALALLKDGLARQQAALDAALQDRLVSVRDYYAQQTAIAQREIDAEIARAQQLLAAQQRVARNAGTEAERVRAKGEVARIEADLIALNNRRAAIEQTNARKAAQAERELADALAAAREELAQLTGTATAEDRRAAIERGYRDLRARLMANGKDASVVDQLIDVKAAQANLSALESQWQQVTERLRNAQDAIGIQQQAGLLTEAQARQQIVALQQQSATEMARLLPAMQQAAEAIGPDAVARVQAWQNELARTKLVVDDVAVAVNGAVQNGFAQMFQDIVSGAKSAKDAFLDFARSVVSAIQRIAAQKLAEQILGGLGNGGFGGVISGLLKGFATGGYVTGPGTASSDSIPARLSAGEYVVRAAAVQQVGVGFLDAINGLRQPPSMVGGRLAFAAGGLVPDVKPQAAANQSVRIVNVVDPALAADYLNSSAGERTILNVLQRNAGAIKQVLA